jgi:uracil-DNA glycosylase family 4
MPLDEQRQEYLRSMGIQVWIPRRRILREAVDSPDRADAMQDDLHDSVVNTVDVPVSGNASLNCLLDWDDLEARVTGCTACPLHQGRTQTVFGVGNREAEWMVIGEAPGEQEDLQGEPFVGRAGQLLNEMIRAVGLRREAVYIANVIKCRPPKNRDPAPDEAAACEEYLKGQVALIKPKIILAVGRIAAQNLLKTGTAIGKLRGQVHYYGQIPLVVTYHPAYLLRSQTEKRRAWEDLKLAMRTFRQQNNT